MKLKYLIISAAVALASFAGAHAANLLGYQAAVTDAEGNALVSTPVTFNIAIHQSQPSGPVVYAETASTQTSPAGIAYLSIGANGGMASLEDLNWATDTYFLEVNYETTAGKVSLGTTQILGVPHAMYADTAAGLLLTSPSGKKFEVVIDDNGQLKVTPAE